MFYGIWTFFAQDWVVNDVSFRGAMKKLTKNINKMACNYIPPANNAGSLTIPSEAKFWEKVGLIDYLKNDS